MSGLGTFVGVLVLSTATVVYSQTNGTKPPDSGGIGGTQEPTGTVPNPCAKQPEQAAILTDTMGVDFGPYLKNVVKTVRQSWYSVMPPSVYPPEKKQGRLSIEFTIQKDGKITGERVDKSSGDAILDRVAFGSINGSGPFNSLPKEFAGQQLELRFYFYYNLTPDTSPLYISPCIDVRVPVGSTFQFSVPIGGIEQAAVTWSLSGPSCEKTACGTISENGLYTAPKDVPNPPTVFVEATPRSGKSLPARTQLTVVRSDPPH
jgi:TonB family protein